MQPVRHHFNINEDGRLAGFSWADYAMFVGMLLLSLLIGVFYAYRNRMKANEEFLLGGRNMTCGPVSMSLVASYISAILVLGEIFDGYAIGCSTRKPLPPSRLPPFRLLSLLPAVSPSFFFQVFLSSVLHYSSSTAPCFHQSLISIQLPLLCWVRDGSFVVINVLREASHRLLVNFSSVFKVISSDIFFLDISEIL